MARKSYKPEEIIKLLRPERRRQCVRHVQQQLGVSERRACNETGTVV